MNVKSNAFKLKILTIIACLFLALPDSGWVLADEIKDIPRVVSSSKTNLSVDRILLEPNTVIIRRQGDKPKEKPDLDQASWWEKLLYKFKILQAETEFVDDGMEKTINGEKTFLLLLIPIALFLFWQNNSKLTKKSSRSRSRRSKR